MTGIVLAREDFESRTVPVRAIGAADVRVHGGAISGGMVRCADLQVTSRRSWFSGEANTTTLCYHEDLGTVIIVGAGGNSCPAVTINSSASFFPLVSQFTKSWRLGFFCEHNVVLQSSGSLDVLPLVLFDDADVALTIEKIRETLHEGRIDEEDNASATNAAEQAIALLRRGDLRGRPRVMMSDDGVLTLQWRDEARGAALIFTGDGTVSIALKDVGISYSESLEGIALDARMPEAFIAAVEAIAG